MSPNAFIPPVLPQVWRDTYSLACLLSASLLLLTPSAGSERMAEPASGAEQKRQQQEQQPTAAAPAPEGAGPGATRAVGSSSGGAHTEALRLLDLGLMMGGPALRSVLHAAVEAAEAALAAGGAEEGAGGRKQQLQQGGTGGGSKQGLAGDTLDVAGQGPPAKRLRAAELQLGEEVLGKAGSDDGLGSGDGQLAFAEPQGEETEQEGGEQQPGAELKEGGWGAWRSSGAVRLPPGSLAGGSEDEAEEEEEPEGAAAAGAGDTTGAEAGEAGSVGREGEGKKSKKKGPRALASRPPVAHLPSLEEFLLNFMAAPGGGRPAVITGGSS